MAPRGISVSRGSNRRASSSERPPVFAFAALQPLPDSRPDFPDPWVSRRPPTRQPPEPPKSSKPARPSGAKTKSSPDLLYPAVTKLLAAALVRGRWLWPITGLPITARAAGSAPAGLALHCHFVMVAVVVAVHENVVFIPCHTPLAMSVPVPLRLMTLFCIVPDSSTRFF